ERIAFETGTDFPLEDLNIHPFRITHDTADPVGFLITDKDNSIAYCTDTGKVTTLIQQRLRHCQGLILEANYDPLMLMEGPYPMHIKQRVRSNQGHLANGDTARFLAELIDSPLQQVVLAHLSETNNQPELAHARIHQEIAQLKPKFSLELARQDRPTPLFALPHTEVSIHKHSRY
ncbi:MAG: MBL fold metallo-hydrolase, partial [Candidatus Electrothrix sp. AR4]|nr:MBL fold metallo-hydrolase [Candidatus Electrothrix sp. AR4]